jgi:hypothetical protein
VINVGDFQGVKGDNVRLLENIGAKVGVFMLGEVEINTHMYMYLVYNVWATERSLTCNFILAL